MASLASAARLTGREDERREPAVETRERRHDTREAGATNRETSN